MVMTLCPSLDSSIGRPETTSPKPPVLLQGVTSAEMKTRLSPAVVVSAVLRTAAAVDLSLRRKTDRRVNGVAPGKRRAEGNLWNRGKALMTSRRHHEEQRLVNARREKTVWDSIVHELLSIAATRRRGGR